jgi:hypothetical protein
MSMLNPLGQRDLAPSRRGGRRTRRGLVVLLIVVVLAGAAVGAWRYLGGASDDDTATPRVSCPPSVPPPTVVAPAQVRVNVYNATQRRGLASAVAAELKKRGFTVGKVANDPLKRSVTGLAEVRASTTGADASRTVVAQVGQVVLVPDQRTDASVDLVLGATFKALVPPAAAAAAVTPTPSPRPPGC